MSIIKKKGKWQFGYKDTYNLDSALRPIIGAGLQKFYDVLKDREKNNKTFGVPIAFCNPDRTEDEEVTSDEWFTALESMLYAFTAEEPDMDDFGVSISMEFVELPVDHKFHSTAKSIKFTYTPDEESYEVYRKACAEHEAKVQYGYELFGKHYQNLWW